MFTSNWFDGQSFVFHNSKQRNVSTCSEMNFGPSPTRGADIKSREVSRKCLEDCRRLLGLMTVLGTYEQNESGSFLKLTPLRLLLKQLTVLNLVNYSIRCMNAWKKTDSDNSGSWQWVCKCLRCKVDSDRRRESSLIKH